MKMRLSFAAAGLALCLPNLAWPTDYFPCDNALYDSLFKAYLIDSKTALVPWKAATERERTDLFDFVVWCKGNEVGDHTAKHGVLKPHERVNAKGFIDWRLRLRPTIGLEETKFLWWYWTTVTNLEPEADFGLRSPIKDIVRDFGPIGDRYKTNDELLSSYLMGIGDGFKQGISGTSAHLVDFQDELSTGAARANGFRSGFLHGQALFRSISGKDTERQGAR